MPIKFQCLGGGGGQTLMITTNPNVQVKLSNEKYSKTITTNAHGQAEFKNLKAGRYTCIAKIKSDKAFTKEIIIKEYRDEYFGVLSQLKDVPLREKVKLSNGMEFTIMGKNVKYHQTNSVTLICNVGIDACTSDQYAYGATNMPGLSTEYYNALQQYEKTQIILHSFYFEHYKNSSYQNPVSGYEQTTGYFYAPSYNEMFGTRDNGEEEGVPLGFENAKDKIKHDRYGDACAYATRDATYRDRDDIYGYYWVVTPSGTAEKSYDLYRHGVDKCLFLPCCDIKDDTWLIKKDDGYWEIVENRDTPLVKNLPLNSKIKLANGKTFVLQAKNVSGHAENSATFMSEFIIENAKWGTGVEKVSYLSSDLCKTTLNGYYNELSPTEKSCVRPYDSYGNFWLMSESEAGSLNLSVQSSRIKKHKNGQSGDWTTRDYADSVGEQIQDGEPQDGVTKFKRDSFQNATVVWTGGKFAQGTNIYEGVEVSYSNDPTWRTESGAYKECGVVPFFDLDGDAMCEKGSDGYYRILGM